MNSKDKITEFFCSIGDFALFLSLNCKKGRFLQKKRQEDAGLPCL